MHVAVLDGAPERPASRERERREDSECHPGDRLAPDDVNPVDRRVPVRVRRHEEVDRDDGDEETVDREARRRDELHAALEARRGSVVLALREPAQGEREERQHGEAEREAHDDACRVHVRRAVAQDLVARDARGVGPRVDVAEAEDERDREERDEGQRPRRGLEDAPDDQAPGPVRHVVEHRDRERTERHAEHEREGDEVRAVELGGVRDRTPRGKPRRRRRRPRARGARRARGRRRGAPSRTRREPSAGEFRSLRLARRRGRGRERRR